ncbi:MFS transporter [Saccharibacter sp. 17.LH.SD]|uniref:peptide MFS transporter n=1 Tax=Saccharibacter sp. 17.LH.SD TaxID=2689393 RepID=UPI0013707637|nr:oligopeptide:H+ symporter [Saccharibacter sp. 17.LH.SD]MXV43785.1 MFS transporter [Saccharibacter sp. 17.LH.SD]
MSNEVARSLSFLPARRRAFSVVFAIELWERSGYYGMQAVLTLFMVEHLHMCDSDVNDMQGALGWLIYALPVLGGVIGDRLLGIRPTLVCGAIGLTIGYFTLALSLTMPIVFLPSLALIALANGLFKPNAGALVRQIYAGDGAALDAAFTLYYMSVNVGSTFSMLLMPWLQQRFGPMIAFMVCGFGLLIGVIYYKFRSYWLDNFFSEYRLKESVGFESPENGKRLWGGLGLGFLVTWGAATTALRHIALMHFVVVLAIIGLLLLWYVIYRRAAVYERAGLLLSYILSLQTMAYLVFYQQQQSSLTLFALRAVSGAYKLGRWTLFSMSAGQFQALNPIWIMVLSPLLAWLYQREARTGREIMFPLKILGGYVCVGLACLLLWQASSRASGLISPWVMVASYGAMSLGELLTMGLGLAIIARYAPMRVSALLMGSMYFLWSVGMYGGGMVANLAAMPVNEIHEAHQAFFYAPLFRNLFLSAGALCIVVLVFLPLIKRLDVQHRASVR